MYHVQHGSESYVCREIEAETETHGSFRLGAPQPTRTEYTHQLRLNGITAINDEWLPISDGGHNLFVTESLTITILDPDGGDDT